MAASAAAPFRASSVCIVGLGLIGGSVALGLRERLSGLRLIGVDRCARAQHPRPDIVDEFISAADEAAVEHAYRRSELVVLAAPVSEIQRALPAALAPGCIVTDCGSTKRAIVATASGSTNAARFVAGHPMAGAGRHGAAPSAGLFAGRSWLLCPEAADAEAVQLVEAMVECLGARPVRMTAAEHDRAVAWTSHAPRIISSLLTVLASREQALASRGPAFERLMRGAGGAPAMWADVLTSNRDEIARSLRALIAELQICAGELESDADPQTNLAALSAADQARGSVDALPLSRP